MRKTLLFFVISIFFLLLLPSKVIAIGIDFPTKIEPKKPFTLTFSSESYDREWIIEIVDYPENGGRIVLWKKIVKLTGGDCTFNQSTGSYACKKDIVVFLEKQPTRLVTPNEPRDGLMAFVEVCTMNAAESCKDRSKEYQTAIIIREAPNNSTIECIPILDNKIEDNTVKLSVEIPSLKYREFYDYQEKVILKPEYPKNSVTVNYMFKQLVSPPLLGKLLRPPEEGKINPIALPIYENPSVYEFLIKVYKETDFGSAITKGWCSFELSIPDKNSFQKQLASTPPPPAATSPSPQQTTTPSRPPESVDLSKIQGGIKNFTLANATLGDIVGKTIPFIFGAAGILLLLYLIWGGFDYMTSRGNPEAIEKAQEKITKAIIGFTIVFLAYWLVQILGIILKLEKFQQIFQ